MGKIALAWHCYSHLICIERFFQFLSDHQIKMAIADGYSASTRRDSALAGVSTPMSVEIEPYTGALGAIATAQWL